MFSVIIPYYKKRQYIERCIDSVLQQTYRDYEIILVDDGSQDDISDLLASRYGGKVKLIVQQNQGVSAARNSGIAIASHEFIAFLDADDFWSPQYLHKNSQLIEKESDIKIIGSHYTRNIVKLEVIDEKLNYTRFVNYFNEALKNTYFFTSATIVHKHFFLTNEGFNSDIKRGEDLDVWFRAVASGGNAFFIQNTLVFYSDEDINQATKNQFKLSESLLFTMNDSFANLSESTNRKDLKIFADKFVRSRLLLYYFQKENHQDAKKILQKTAGGNFAVRIIYSLPFIVGNYLLSHNVTRKFILNIIKNG